MNRSWRLSIARTFVERRNRTVGWIIGIISLYLVLLLTVPALRGVFRFRPILPTDALVVLVAGVVGVLWFEVYKAVTGRRRPSVPAESK